MQSDKVLVICTLKEALVTKYSKQLEYLPLSNEDTDLRWQALIQQYRPKTIIFGLQNLDEAKLSFWRSQQPNDHLRFVRKGTSLHRVDFEAAKKYQIEVLNTAGVNAPFVAAFVINELLAHNFSDHKLGIIGIGDIGKLVVTESIKLNSQPILYNRTRHPFDTNKYTYTNDLVDLFNQATRIAICLPLTGETKGIITEEHIKKLAPNSKIVCISPPKVFSENAILVLDKRTDLDITFDHVSSGLQYLFDTLGRSQLPAHIHFDEKAAAGYECQYAMGEAAILKAC